MHRFLIPVFVFFILPVAYSQASGPYTYRRLEGTVGAQPVVMHLHESNLPSLDQTGPLFTGVYYYTKYEAPISFWGQSEKGGEIVLTEAAGTDQSPALNLRRVGADRFTGTWTNGKKNAKKLSVELRENYPAGAVRFTSGSLHDEKKMFPQRRESPMATVGISWLEPAAGVDKPQRAFLLDAVAHTLFIDTIDGKPCCATPRAAFEQLRREQFGEYPGDLAEGVDPDSIDMFFMYNNDYAVQTVVAYNDNRRLSLGYTTSTYTGGAHGYYATDFRVYDLEKRKELTLNDFIKPGQEKVLEAALNRAARRRAGLKPGDAIAGYYFVESIPITENFYATGKGLVFTYPPYEIASYADGQVELFVPFEEIRTSLQR